MTYGRLARRLLADALLAAVCLCVFALFHHVLPRSGGQPLAVIGATAEPAADMATEAAGGTAARQSASTATPAASGKGSRGGRSGGQGASSGEKGGSAAENVDTQVASAAGVNLAQKWASQFTESVVQTETGYTGPTVSLTLSENTLQTETGEIVYYVADIYLADVTCLQTALAQGMYGTGYRASIPAMAEESGALLAINGDYYGNTSEGVVIRNGVVYRANATDCDVCVLYRDGSMGTLSGASFTLEDAIANGAWQAWTFGPALLTAEGERIASFASTRRLISANPRTAIGYYEPGHYCFVTVDGRGESVGITLPQLSQLFEQLGCTAAYNLDGGNSSVMVYQGEVVNQPSGGGRESSDCILITEASTR